jgi:hypothetical protein
VKNRYKKLHPIAQKIKFDEPVRVTAPGLKEAVPTVPGEPVVEVPVERGGLKGREPLVFRSVPGIGEVTAARTPRLALAV